MTENKILQSIVAGMFSMTDEEVASLIMEDGNLKEDADTIILNQNASKIKRLQEAAKGDKDKFFDNGYSKGKKETAKRFESEFLEITKFETDKTTFDEMVKDFAATKAKTIEDVKLHPDYIALEKNAIPKDKYDALETEFNNFKTNIEKSKVFDSVKSKAWDITSNRNPILSDNPAVAKTRREDFLVKLEGYDYQLNGDDILVLKEGKRLEDEHGNALSFETHVNVLGDRNFDFNKQGGKGNAGNNNKPNPSGIEPKDKGEYTRYLASDAGAKEKYEYMQKYKGKF